MSCWITAHPNLLALPVFNDLTPGNQASGLSFFFAAVVFCILSFLHAHHDAATGWCNRSHLARTALACPEWISDTGSRLLPGQKPLARNFSIAFTVR